eukprot:TRINITY_DN272_c0_g1_i1.p1 TRINITY_DN272_c0_g1~~TRINITY_DN272_c0_g1_i1.p1  ORF type:complete len:311 (-),score=125.09 TRINITY_DN272_c0_g1_i1:39-926(-)
MSYTVPNKHVKDIKVDYLYHLGLNSGMDLKAMFGDVKVVCMGGSANRMALMAKRLQSTLGVDIPLGTELAPIGKTDRYSLYKVGPVLAVNHGMGQPSISILLHELAKLLMYAGATDFTFIRIGTSGGVGLEPGTVVISTEAVDGQLRAQHDTVILGKVVARPTKFSEQLTQSFFDIAGDDIPVALGKTMATDDFYEGQGRVDGAICDYTEADKFEFLKKCHDVGVRNIEMECGQFIAFCNKANIGAVDICCTLLDRLKGDQVDSTPEQLAAFVDNAIGLALRWIKAKVGAQSSEK